MAGAAAAPAKAKAAAKAMVRRTVMAGSLAFRFAGRSVGSLIVGLSGR
jgi:hypothetical protein